jgi:uncharacterized protein YjbI with pentapeptide repeats
MANEEHLQRLKQGVRAWNTWREEHLKVEIDPSKVHFSNFRNAADQYMEYLARKDLAKADLEPVDLSKADLSKADLGVADLYRANLASANLIGAVLFHADLRQADLSGADLSGADLNGADLRGANLTAARFSEADLRQADLSGADLSGTILTVANLREANLSNATLSRIDLYRANLFRANLSNVDLREAVLRGATLRGADLNGAVLSKADLNEADIRGANLRGANLSNASLSGADLSGADLRGANLSSIDLREAVLRGATLQGADLRQADLREAKLRGAQLNRADLSGVDFRLAVLMETNLNSATLTNACLWDTQCAGWLIQGIICEAAYWDRDRIKRTTYSVGEFEKLHTDKTKIILDYPGGLSTIEIVTLPALIQQMTAASGCILRLQSIQEAPGGGTVTLIIEDLGGHALDDLKERAKQILKRCTRSLSKPRSYEETMRCRSDPAPEPMPAEATHLSPPCCVSTHRSRVVDPDGPTTFLDHREALFGIPQMISFTQGSGHRERFPVESSPPPISEDSYRGEAPCSLAPCTRGSNVTSPSVGGLSGCAPALCSF